MKVSRALVAYAFVSEAFEKIGDIATGLAELFGPLLAETPDERFDPDAFVKQVKDVLDIEMHPYVAETMVPRFLELGYLNERIRTKDYVEYVISKIEVHAPAVPEEQVSLLLERFDSFAKRYRLGRDELFRKMSLEDEFLNRLVRPEFLDLIHPHLVSEATAEDTSVLRLPGSKETTSRPSSAIAQMDVLTASFIMELRRSNGDLFELVVNISAGALLAEVVLNTQTPTTKTDGLSQLKIFVDGPLVMDALALNRIDHAAEYATRLFQQLTEAGAQLFVFEHTLTEIRNAIRAPLSRFARNEYVSGPLGDLLRRDRNMVNYCRGVLGNLHGEIENIGIRVFQKLPDTDMRKATFSDENEQELVAGFGLRNVEARQRDAKSVATVLRLRGSFYSEQFARCKYLFITRNNQVAAVSKDFLIKNRLAQEEYFPPTITDRYVAGLLWVAFGGGGKDLSRLKMISNCSATVRPREDVVANMRRVLERIDETKVAKFEAIMTDERAGHFLMELTMGDAELVRDDNVIELYESIRRVTAIEVEEEYGRKVEDIRANYASQLGASERSLEQVEHALQESEQMRTQIEGDIEMASRKAQWREKRQLSICVSKGVARVRLVETIVVFVVAIVTGVVSYLSASSQIAMIAASLLSALCLANYMLLPGKFLDHLIRKHGENFVTAEADKLNLSLDGYTISWAEKQVVPLKGCERDHK